MNVKHIGPLSCCTVTRWSPYLNPTDMLWQDWKWAICLQFVWKEEWAQLPPQWCKKLILIHKYFVALTADKGGLRDQWHFHKGDMGVWKCFPLNELIQLHTVYILHRFPFLILYFVSNRKGANSFLWHNIAGWCVGTVLLAHFSPHNTNSASFEFYSTPTCCCWPCASLNGQNLPFVQMDTSSGIMHHFTKHV